MTQTRERHSDEATDPVRRPSGGGGRKPRRWLRAGVFLIPCGLLLTIYIVYPVAFTVGRSLFDRTGNTFVGLENYSRAFEDQRTLVALRNNLIWVLVAPTLVTAIGLIIAVLSERVKWATAFRVVLFMPMAISLFASGVIFRLVYEQDPNLGVTNAALVSVHDAFAAPSPYPGARPRTAGKWSEGDSGLQGIAAVSPGDVVAVPMAGVRPAAIPASAASAVLPRARPGEIRGTVWLDVSAEGSASVIDQGERGMPGVAVELIHSGVVVAGATTGDDGAFVIPDLAPGSYEIRLPARNFAAPFRGLTWLGPDLITPVIISAWIWITTGFAVTFIAAGLAAIPRDALEAARVDGATEWQVFRKVTVPLLAPVLVVVFVTLAINVLKVFDLVYVVAPGSSQAEANVLALEMWQVSFGAGGDQGLGSALAVLLLLLVLPAIVFNVRRFRRVRV